MIKNMSGWIAALVITSTITLGVGNVVLRSNYNPPKAISKEMGLDISILDRIRDNCTSDVSLTYTSREGINEVTVYCDNIYTLQDLGEYSTPYYKNNKSQQQIDKETE